MYMIWLSDSCTSGTISHMLWLYHHFMYLSTWCNHHCSVRDVGPVIWQHYVLWCYAIWLNPTMQREAPWPLTPNHTFLWIIIRGRIVLEMKELPHTSVISVVQTGWWSHLLGLHLLWGVVCVKSALIRHASMPCQLTTCVCQLACIIHWCISSNKVYKPTFHNINAICQHALCQCKYAM